MLAGTFLDLDLIADELNSLTRLHPSTNTIITQLDPP